MWKYYPRNSWRSSIKLSFPIFDWDIRDSFEETEPKRPKKEKGISFFTLSRKAISEIGNYDADQ